MNEEKKCITWVSWKNTYRPKAGSGLGIKHIGLFNKALLCKWKWQILNKEGTLWKQILVAKYGDVNRVVLFSFEIKTNKKHQPGGRILYRSALRKLMCLTILQVTSIVDLARVIQLHFGSIYGWGCSS